jgi:hypothetical protein
MQNKFVWSFLSLVTLGAGGLLGGCDSDAKIAKSALGESCDKTSDCDDGLKCVEGTCYKKSSGSGGSSSNAGGEGNTAGTDPVGPKPPVLGGLGESCTKRADCEDGLACLSQRCSEDGGGVGGEGSGGPALGGIGETCGLTSDCADGLACLPTDGYLDRFAEAKAIGSNSVGVCSVVDNGLTPTGNTCHLAECKTAEDCCELPTAVHIPYAVVNTPGVSGPYGTGANSCTQLAALLDGVNCATTKVVAQQVQCFAQAAYCDCGAKTWACSEAGTCEYTAACVAATVGPVTGGCAAFSRTGHPLTQTCNKAKKCVAEAVAGCEVDADCDETVLVAGSQTVDYCTDGKCVCNTDNGLCYRGCAEDLDCPVRYSCDTKASLCRPTNECDSDAYCVTKNNDINAKCVDGACQGYCRNDLDCNGGLLTNGTYTQVCNAQHVCEAVGCNSDDECPEAGGVRTFCTKALEVGDTGTVVSAITD